MESFAPRARPRSRAWIGPAALAALATFVSIGCVGPTPIKDQAMPTFLETMEELSLSYQVDREIGTLLLPPATAGSGSLTYSLTPAIPGLTFDGNVRTLTGTPTEVGEYDMTYRAMDEDDNTATLDFTITVETATVVRTLVSAVAAGDADGRLRFMDLPEPDDGPAVLVRGNPIVTAGGSFFLDVATDRPADKLLVSIGEEPFGYYEIDLETSASSHRLTGQLPFDLDPALGPFCLQVTGVDDSGAAGPPACQTLRVAAVDDGQVEITVSWDTDATLDLIVVDPNGHGVYYLQPEVPSGGVLDLASFCGPRSFIRNAHVAWSKGSPPPGRYEVRVYHRERCDAEETNYLVSVYNHGRTSTYSGMFTGPGSAEGGDDLLTRDVVTVFEVPGVAGRPQRTPTVSSTYRGSGDQVFVLNPGGEILDDTLLTLELGDASADVYVIATNASIHHADPHVERLDIRDATGRAAATEEEYEPAPRTWESQPVAERAWVTEFNNNPPLSSRLASRSGRLQAQSQGGVAEGDRFTFTDRDDDDNRTEIPATARKVVTDGTTTAAVWVGDRDWWTRCGTAEKCVTQEMVDAVAERFLRPGAGNDIYDWVTAVFGAPWGPHPYIDLISPEAAGEIHILFFDIDDDGIPLPGQIRTGGFFVGLNNFLRDPDHPFPDIARLSPLSNERLIFFMDSALLAARTGPTWEVTDRGPTRMIGVLAHEFQHMIHFYQKPILRDTGSAAWLNEMSSEVAQDLIADKLMDDGPRGVAYDDATAGEPANLRGRLPEFNFFNDIRVTSWQKTLANYSINYALGAYLARTYGAALFSDIVQSDRAGVDAIEGALDGLGRDVSFGDVLANWAAATLLSDNTAAPAPYRYNPGTWTTSHAGGIDYRLGSIDLFNYAWEPPGVSLEGYGPNLIGRLTFVGPYLHSLRTFNGRTQPPHSNMYATIGRATGTVRLSVSALGDNRITVVVKE